MPTLPEPLVIQGLQTLAEQSGLNTGLVYSKRYPARPILHYFIKFGQKWMRF